MGEGLVGGKYIYVLYFDEQEHQSMPKISEFL